jgi:hypothetical protein
MSAGAAVAAAYQRYKRAFIDAGATTAETAKTLAEVGCTNSRQFRWMVSDGIFVETSPGRFYFDAVNAPAIERRSRVKGFWIAAVATLVIGVLVLLLRAIMGA